MHQRARSGPCGSANSAQPQRRGFPISKQNSHQRASRLRSLLSFDHHLLLPQTYYRHPSPLHWNDVGCSAAEGLIDGLESGLGTPGCVSWVLEGRKLCCYKSCSRVADSASSRFALFTSYIKEISSALLARLLDQIVRTSHPSSPFRTEPTEKYLLTTRCSRTQPYGVRTALSACSTARSAAH